MNEKLKNIAEKVRRLANIPEEENFGSVIAILMKINCLKNLLLKINIIFMAPK